VTRPRLYDATDALAWVARDILRNRMTGYPAAVEARKMHPIAAEAGLRIAAAIAADWTIAIELSPHFGDSAFVAHIRDLPLPQPLDRAAIASPAERRKSLQDVLAHPRVAEDPAYAELVEALLWWEEAPLRGDMPIAQLNRINAELRARAQARQRLAA
jgi:hypothetical protein